ncbi:MAG: phosphate butyryltransferase [Erysipelothrix sp.]|nr:phosphate butyryltransferase [Erysipelothrix sp.]
MFDTIKTTKVKTIVVAVAQDKEVLSAIASAQKEGLIEPILIGDQDKIRHLCDSINLSIDSKTVIDEKDNVQACKKAVQLINQGKADILMKGLVDTSVLLKAVLNKQTGILSAPLLSHLSVIKTSKREKAYYMTDTAITILPDVAVKQNLIENALKVLKKLGIQQPKVGIISAVEKVTPKMISTVDAEKLVEAYKNDPRLIIEGPLALDIAVSKQAAIHKGYQSQIAGEVDLLLMPNLESANVLYKALVYFTNAQSAAIAIGAKVPIVMTSRSDSEKSKLNSIKLSCLVAESL